MSVGTNTLTKLIQTESWQLAIEQAKANPQEARAWSTRPGFFEGIKESDVLPIHQACAARCPSAMVEALYRAYPHSLAARESAYRRMPLHIACRSGSDIETMSLLLKYFKDAAAVDDNLGRLPLHYALSNGANESVVLEVLKACPGGTRAYDRRGWLPIHVACSVGATKVIVEALLKEFPASITLETNKGSDPIKCCYMHHAAHRDEVIAMLKAAKSQWTSDHVKAKRPSSVRLLV